jgi:serine/threonine-protein kinase
MTMYSLRLIVPWICVMFIYGSFIPNTWQRCAAHIAPLALIPIAIFAVTCSKMPGGHEVLTSRVMLEMILWLGVPAFTAVFGAHMLSTLRRKAAMAKELGAYFLKQRLGAGGMGEVFLAEHKLLKRPCAIKLIRPNQAHDPLAISRFEREVQATAKLTHWNTIEIFDYGHTEDGTFYYVMEYLPGMSLQDLVDLYGPMPTDRAIHFLTQVCDGLHEAHGMGLIHRDIKPGNVFASYRGGRWDVAKLLDFGLVSSVSREFGAATNGNARTVVGTPLFASPEWTLPDGQLDGRSDIYSLGAVGYFLVTGQPVFTHQSPMKLLLAHTHEAVRPIREINPDVPADFEAVVMKCLAKRPEDRYATALELRRALERTPASSTWTQERAVAWWNGVDTASVDARQESDPGAVTQVFEISEVA